MAASAMIGYRNLAHPRKSAMDDVQQLGEMLRHYADSEAHKKQQFEV